MPPNTLVVTVQGHPHNGEGRPEFQMIDPVDGKRVGGQIAAIRTALRFRRATFAWARRQGKTSTRKHLYPLEASLTSGIYRAGMLLPDHTTAFKIWEEFKIAWGPFIRDAKGDDKSQDRWIELRAFAPQPFRPGWLPPHDQRWERAVANPNTGCKVWFWSGQHPYYRKIQGFPFHFNRISPDECAQIHPGFRKIVMPMLRDSRGSADFSGTPDVNDIGNGWFHEFFMNGFDPSSPGWASLRYPDGCNPHVPPATAEDDKDLAGEDDIRQARYAEFLTDKGAVFANLDNVLVLPYERVGDKPSIPAWVKTLKLAHPLGSLECWFNRTTPVQGHIYVVSIDWARSPKGDFSVLAVWNLTLHRQEAVLRWRGEDFPTQLEWVVAFKKHYGARQIHADANGMGEPMADFLRRRHETGAVLHRFGRNKADYVRKGQVLFQEAEVQLIDCLEQRREFHTFQGREPSDPTSDSRVHYTHQPGGHDDFVASFLHVAPTMTISPRQSAVNAEKAEDTVDSRGRVSPSYFGESPWESLEEPLSSPAAF